MFVTYFSQTQTTLLLAAGVFLLLSLVFHLRDREKWAVLFLVTASLLANLFGATLDSFLNLWDERFHALVARNLMDHPLMPTLYDDPVVDMAYDRWDRYHVWLHKQPLFLWQIALSFKLFGVSEFTLRIPSALLGTVFVLIGYRSGKLLVGKRTGYITGLFMISSAYFLELVAGRQEVDHNDVSFIVYISLSLWALIEYWYSGKKGWVLLIGLFAGMAILCKWLAGMLVYLFWLIHLIQGMKFRLKEVFPFIMALLVTVAVALPWQILCLAWYPTEARMAFDLNSRHFFEAVDGHRGEFWYHFRNIGWQYGRITPYLMIPAWIVLYIRMNRKRLFLPLVLMTLAVYLFFSLATTKMPSFPLIVSMPVFIALASLTDAGLEFIKKIKMHPAVYGILVFLVLMGLVATRFDVKKIQEKHTLRGPDNIETRWLTHNRQVFKALQLPPNTVLFNVRGRHYIEAMFYTGLPAYNFIPAVEQYLEMKQKGRNIAIFQSQDTELPDYLLGDTAIIVIDSQLLGWD